MKILEFISEVSTPTGSIFIRFKEKVGEVSANPQRGEKSEATYLTAYAGFANAPEDLKQADALRNFNAINSAQDIVSMIKAIFTDKVFLSAKSVTIYDDFTKPMQGDSSPIYKRHPFLLKFMKWVEREGGDQIKIADKVSQEGPPKMKRPRKENPNKGRKIRDIEQGETKKTVTFTVSTRFYKEIQNNLPNIMKYRGPNHTFVMPSEMFMAFKSQAESKFPFADIKVLKHIATGEDLTTPVMASASGPNWDQNGGRHSLSEEGEKPKVVHCSQCGKGFNAAGLKAPHHTGFSHCKDHKGMKAVVSENLNEGSDKSAYDCGIVDGYYGRSANPHKYVMGKRVILTDPKEINQYMTGYKDDSTGSKVYEGFSDMSTPTMRAKTASRFSHDPDKAATMYKANKDGYIANRATTSDDSNILLQLKSNLDTATAKPLIFQDGSKLGIRPSIARKALAKLENMRPVDKHRLINNLMKSKDAFVNFVRENESVVDEGEVDEAKPTAGYCKSTKPSNMSASWRASCIARGAVPRTADKSVLFKRGAHKGERKKIKGLRLKTSDIGGRDG